MQNQIYKFINYEFNNFKNTLFVYFVDEEVGNFVKNNIRIENVAQVKELQRILSKCISFDFQLNNNELEKIINVFDFLYNLIICDYKQIDYLTVICNFISQISLEIFIENKDWLLSNDTSFSHTIFQLKDIEISSNINEIAKNILIVINEYSKINNIKIANKLEAKISIFKYSEQLLSCIDF